MPKKLIPIFIIVALILFVIIKSCMGNGKINLKVTPVLVEDKKPDTIRINVFVENSGSMDAYMCAGSQLKDAVFDYVSDLKKVKGNSETVCGLYYINSQTIPYAGSLDSFIKDLTPASFAHAGGNRSNTDLRAILKSIVSEQESNTISVFVSDCILDVPQNALNFFGNCQVSVKNTFVDAMTSHPELGVQIARLESKFEGRWFCGHNVATLSNVSRPYYIWLIGDARLLAEANRVAPIGSVIHGIKNYAAFSPVHNHSFDIDKKHFVANHTGKTNVELLVNLDATLQNEETITNIRNYTCSDSGNMRVTGVRRITAHDSKYSHVVTVELTNAETLKECSVTFSYPAMPGWVETYNDDSGENVEQNIEKTTGVKYLINGVAEAYKEHASQAAQFTFTVTNK